MTALALALPLRAQLSDDDYKTIDTARIMVLYNLSFVEDSTQMDFVRNETMMLLLGKHLSLFKSYNAYRADLMMRKKEKEGLLGEWFESPESISPTGLCMKSSRTIRTGN